MARSSSSLTGSGLSHWTMLAGDTSIRAAPRKVRGDIARRASG